MRHPLPAGRPWTQRGRGLVLGLVLATLLAASLAAQAPDGEDSPVPPLPAPRPVAQIIQALLDRAIEGEAEDQQQARHALLAYGADALPPLVARLHEDPAAEAGWSLLEALADQMARPPERAPVVSPEVQSFLRAHLEQARDLARRSELERAEKHLSAIIELTDPGWLRDRAVALRKEVRDELVRASVLDARVVTDQDRYGLDQEITVRLVLTNKTSGPVAIPLRAERAGVEVRTACVARVVYTATDPLGQTLSATKDLLVPIAGDLQLAAGASQELLFRIDPSQDHPSILVPRTYTIDATLRPFEIQTAATNLYRSIPFEPRTVEVFPVGWEAVAEDPLGRLHDYLQRGKLHAAAIAAWLIPETDREAAVELLIQNLRDGPEELAPVLATCLSRLTGEPPRDRPSDWLEWWDSRAPAGTGKEGQ